MSKTRETADAAEASAASGAASAAPGASAAGAEAKAKVNAVAETTGKNEAPRSEIDDAQAEPPMRERGDVALALSPGQILGGFALMAGFILMLRRRRKGRD